MSTSILELLGINRKSLEEQQRATSAQQAQTRDCFSFKWSRRDSYDSEAVQTMTKDWLLKKGL